MPIGPLGGVFIQVFLIRGDVWSILSYPCINGIGSPLHHLDRRLTNDGIANDSYVWQRSPARHLVRLKPATAAFPYAGFGECVAIAAELAILINPRIAFRLPLAEIHARRLRCGE